MQATQPGSMSNVGMNVVNRLSTGASMMRRASAQVLPFVEPIAAEFTLAQRVARYGFTVLMLAGASALYATLIASTLH